RGAIGQHGGPRDGRADVVALDHAPAAREDVDARPLAIARRASAVAAEHGAGRRRRAPNRVMADRCPGAAARGRKGFAADDVDARKLVPAGRFSVGRHTQEVARDDVARASDLQARTALLGSRYLPWADETGLKARDREPFDRVACAHHVDAVGPLA